MNEFHRLHTVQGAVISLRIDEIADWGSLTVEDMNGRFLSRRLRGTELATVIARLRRAYDPDHPERPLDIDLSALIEL